MGKKIGNEGTGDEVKKVMDGILFDPQAGGMRNLAKEYEAMDEEARLESKS